MTEMNPVALEPVTMQPEQAGGGRFANVPRWLRWALLGSLAANLLVIGLFAGAAWKFRNAAAQGGNLYPGLISFASQLPAARRAELGVPSRWTPGTDRGGERSSERNTELQRLFQELRPLRQDVRAARREAMRLFTAQPLEKTALNTALTRLAEAESRMRQKSDVLAVDFAGKLTADERAAFVRWREQASRGRRGGSGEGADGKVN